VLNNIFLAQERSPIRPVRDMGSDDGRGDRGYGCRHKLATVVAHALLLRPGPGDRGPIPPDAERALVESVGRWFRRLPDKVKLAIVHCYPRPPSSPTPEGAGRTSNPDGALILLVHDHHAGGIVEIATHSPCGAQTVTPCGSNVVPTGRPAGASAPSGNGNVFQVQPAGSSSRPTPIIR
jgi:hypothetical protein